MDIIDFNEIKNKARDKDIDKFEQYIYGLYYSLAQGQITMKDLYSNLNEYMKENNISQEKLINIQKEIMKRYGFNFEDIENQMKSMGIDTQNFNMNMDYEALRKTMSFKEKYKDKIQEKVFIVYEINNIKIYITGNEVILEGEGKGNLKDNKISEFLCSYKKLLGDETLKVSIFENVQEYDY